MFGHKCEKDAFEWHPHASVLLMEMGVGQLGLAIDTKMRTDDVRALIQILTVFRANVAQLFIDCPIIELLVSQINREQVNLLMEMLRSSRILPPDEFPKKYDYNSVARRNSIGLQSGTFFPKLKKLTITSQSNQLEHLSRLLTYAVGVDYLYETDNIDLLCLKIILGGRGHSNQKKHFRLFRHLTKFRQWTAADRLGERYFQQFSGSNRNL
uniref:Uncharacterized protein n=1 Tax=Acrobeloides nanus TaxID=290746 RepID=A0A914DZZ6_9BILA